MIPAPAVQVSYYIRRINIIRQAIFMIDTGASGTCLHGFYAWELQNHMRRNTLDIARGIGGNCPYYGEGVLLVFTDENNQPITRWLRRLDIQKISQDDVRIDGDVLRLPCLLGRDILNEWEFKYNAAQGNVTILVP
jgi:hypothetical protein